MKNGMRDVMIQFDSNRMAEEYYELLYKREYMRCRRKDRCHRMTKRIRTLWCLRFDV